MQRLPYRIITCIVVVFCLALQAVAQDSAGQSVHQSAAPSSFQRHSIAWGLSGAAGDATFDAVSPMFSTAYQYRFSPMFGMEGAVHFLGRAFEANGLTAATATQFHQSSITGDVTLLYTPFADVDGLNRLRIGAGASWRYRSLTFISSRTADQIPNTTVSAINLPAIHTIGGHLKAEYTLPLGTTSEVAFRAQLHLFTPTLQGEPITTRTELFRSGGAVSLGAFLRLGW